jgi:probable phosphoglycerate mutase
MHLDPGTKGKLRIAPHSPKRSIFLIRHAKCGSHGTLLGAADPPLTAEGRAESAELGRRLREESIGRIVSSALCRATETAGIVAAELNLTVEVDQRLNEISYGAWDGLTWAEIESRFPEAAAGKLSDWFQFTPEGAEPFPEFFERVKQAWDSLGDANAGRTAIVAHRTVNAVLLAISSDPALAASDLQRPAGDRIYQFEQPHASFVLTTGPTAHLNSSDK